MGKKYADGEKLIKVETFSTATTLSTHIALSLSLPLSPSPPPECGNCSSLSPPSHSVLRYALSLTPSLAPLSREGLIQTDVTQR